MIISGAFWQGQKKGELWTAFEGNNHINILELNTAKYVVLSFTCMYPVQESVHMQTDGIIVFPYLV